MIPARLVWDPLVRLFHWLNLLFILPMVALGLAIANAGMLGLSPDSRALLIRLHVLVGYGFAINLGVRVIWAFCGPRYARWSAISPFQRGFLRRLRQYLRGLRLGRAPYYLGHNPMGRLMITAMFAALLTQAGTGLVLAGTDLYAPPFGAWIADAVAGPGVDPASLAPGDRDRVDPAAFHALRQWRAPVAETHEIGFYLVVALIALHIGGVVVTELRERSGLVSAMIHGRKYAAGAPVDGAPAETGIREPEPLARRAQRGS